jgi:hypothetical protein
MKRPKNELSTFQKIEGDYDCQQMTVVQLKQECPICGAIKLLEGEISNNEEILYVCEDCEAKHTLCDCGEAADIKRKMCDVCWHEYNCSHEEYYHNEQTDIERMHQTIYTKS